MNLETGGEKEEMKTIRVAIIGQGRSGRCIHGDYLPRDDRFQIVAVVDEIAKRRDFAAREYGCDTYADYHSLFERDDIDLIVNSTYSHLHVPINLEVLEAGYNLLSEKPLANNTEGDAGENAAYSSAAAPTQGGMTGKFYNMLYNTLTNGTPLEITPRQVRRQIAVIEECQRQNPQIWGPKT